MWIFLGGVSSCKGWLVCVDGLGVFVSGVFGVLVCLGMWFCIG